MANLLIEVGKTIVKAAITFCVFEGLRRLVRKDEKRKAMPVQGKVN